MAYKNPWATTDFQKKVAPMIYRAVEENVFTNPSPGYVITKNGLPDDAIFVSMCKTVQPRNSDLMLLTVVTHDKVSVYGLNCAGQQGRTWLELTSEPVKSMSDAVYLARTFTKSIVYVRRAEEKYAKGDFVLDWSKI